MSTQLQQAIELAEAGRKDAARQLLQQVIQAEPYNEIAWFWLAATAADQEKYQRALHRVLVINPANTQARQLLDQAQQQYGDYVSPSVPPSAPASAAPAPPPTAAPMATQVSLPQTPPVIAPPPVAAPPAAAQRSPQKGIVLFVLGLVLVVAAVTIVAAYSLLSGDDEDDGSPTAADVAGGLPIGGDEAEVPADTDGEPGAGAPVDAAGGESDADSGEAPAEPAPDVSPDTEPDAAPAVIPAVGPDDAPVETSSARYKDVTFTVEDYAVSVSVPASWYAALAGDADWDAQRAQLEADLPIRPGNGSGIDAWDDLSVTLARALVGRDRVAVVETDTTSLRAGGYAVYLVLADVTDTGFITSTDCDAISARAEQMLAAAPSGGAIRIEAVEPLPAGDGLCGARRDMITDVTQIDDLSALFEGVDAPAELHSVEFFLPLAGGDEVARWTLWVPGAQYDLYAETIAHIIATARVTAGE